jgi:hypothetical protein
MEEGLFGERYSLAEWNGRKLGWNSVQDLEQVEHDTMYKRHEYKNRTELVWSPFKKKQGPIIPPTCVEVLSQLLNRARSIGSWKWVASRLEIIGCRVDRTMRWLSLLSPSFHAHRVLDAVLRCRQLRLDVRLIDTLFSLNERVFSSILWHGFIWSKKIRPRVSM